MCCSSWGKNISHQYHNVKNSIAKVLGIECNPTNDCEGYCQCTFSSDYKASIASYVASIKALKDAISSDSIAKSLALMNNDPKNSSAETVAIMQELSLTTGSGDIKYVNPPVDTYFDLITEDINELQDAIALKLSDENIDLTLKGKLERKRSELYSISDNLDVISELSKASSGESDDAINCMANISSLSRSIDSDINYIRNSYLTSVMKKELIHDIISLEKVDVEDMHAIAYSNYDLQSYVDNIESNMVLLENEFGYAKSIGLISEDSYNKINVAIDNAYIELDYLSTDVDDLKEQMDNDISPYSFALWFVTR